MRFVIALAVCALVGCMPAQRTPGMIATTPRAHAIEPSLDELARADGETERRALLVVYPTSACSGSASTVLADEEGNFLAAVPPGSASLVSIPARTRALITFSSIEVTAPRASWTASADVVVPPSPDGIILVAARVSARECSNGQYADARPATKAELEATLAESEITWLEPRREEGQAWLDAHADRVAEVLGTSKKAAPIVFARLRSRTRAQ
ncbi:MAG: hypothetical protein KF819_10770 [Labilithrix sp.]|nr:hypothetical protein [Labilithrix sp.]